MAERKSRTSIDWSNHELIVKKTDDFLMHHLKKPDTIVNNVKFINTNGVCLVTGDFGRWSFCREFHPSKDGFVSDYYWVEKLQILSDQKGTEFSKEDTEKEIKEGIEKGLEEYGFEGEKLETIKEYYKDLLENLEEGKERYCVFAWDNIPGFIDGEMIPNAYVIKPWLRAVFDAFDEICRRLED